MTAQIIPGRAALLQAFALALALVVSLGCGGSRPSVTVTEVSTHPSSYQGKKLRLKGINKGAFGFLGMGGFVLTDGKSDVLVLQRGGVLPADGESVVVVGYLRQLAALPRFNGLYIEQVSGDTSPGRD